ncbi:MAG: hypothetical protein HY291_24120 [Planctomycetes bacterium]|nr:hypothetical protein [Planctomycetota bacterium]
MILIFHRCRNCGASLPKPYGFVPDIGSPFYTCDGCKKEILRSNYLEWETMGIVVKALYLIECLVVVYIATFFLGGGLFDLLMRQVFYDEEGSNKSLLMGCRIALFIFSTGFFVYRAGAKIRASRQRMSDPLYRARVQATLT